MEERFECSPTSLKHKIKHSICGCFRHYPSHYDHLSDESSLSSHNRQHRLTRTTSSGGASGPMMRSSKSEEFNLKDKCRSFMNRMSTTPRGTTPRGTTPRGTHHHHRKSHSTDFHYDPLSYALNFEEDAYEDDFPFRNFSSRLPASPPPIRSISDGLAAKAAPSPPDQARTSSTPVSAPPPREITAYS